MPDWVIKPQGAPQTIRCGTFCNEGWRISIAKIIAGLSNWRGVTSSSTYVAPAMFIKNLSRSKAAVLSSKRIG
jgi:hypothetical protein